MSRIVEDLFSPDYELLRLVPNGVHSMSLNADTYLPNVEISCVRHGGKLKFLGQLMGVSLRARLCLPFLSSSLFLPPIHPKPHPSRQVEESELDQLSNDVFQKLEASLNNNNDSSSGPQNDTASASQSK